jgi:hypothetical protein
VSVVRSVLVLHQAVSVVRSDFVLVPYHGGGRRK